MLDTGLRCKNEDHSQKEINLLCTNMNCEKYRTACSDCLRFYHIEHVQDIIDFKQYFELQNESSIFINWLRSFIEEFQQIANQLKALLNKYPLDNQATEHQQTIEQLNNQVEQVVIWKRLKEQISEDLKMLNEPLQVFKQKLRSLKSLCSTPSEQTETTQEQIKNSATIRKSVTIKKENQTITYKKIWDSPIQKSCCRAIAFSQDNNIMIASCDSQIKIFEFMNGQLKEFQTLKVHTQTISAIILFKKSKEFVSASDDSQIFHFEMNNNQRFEFRNIFLDGHEDWVRCIIINKAEDLIISGSADTKIKFWQKKIEWKCFLTLDNHKSQVYCLSLNESETQLVSCDANSQILISQKIDIDDWVVLQVIKVSTFGCKVCFLDDNMFVFQPKKGDKMEVYSLNDKHSVFVRIKEIELEQCQDGSGECLFFPSVFNKQKQLLLHRYGESVFLMKRMNNEEFIIEQTIQFENRQVYGAVTENWEYIVTWDDGSKQYQVRKYM